MIKRILLVLQKFGKKWVFNYEDDISFMLRLEKEQRERLTREKSGQSS
jgi:hypothetical protein